MDDFADQERILAAHQRALNLLEEQAAPYTYSTIPVNKKIELDEKRAEVKQLKSQLEEARSAKQGIQPLDQIEVYSPSLIRVEKDALGIIEWKDNFQPPDENAEIKKGGFLYGEWPQLNNLYQGDFCPRDIYHEKADKIEEFTRKILRTNHLKIFWIGGRSGSGKSVALLYTLSILYKRGYEKILWLGHGASVSKLSAAFKYSKQLAKSNGHPILIGIDDPHIPGEQGDARQHWQDALNEITIELQTNNTEDITSLPVIVCCSPTERKDIFQELNEVSAYIEIEFSPMTSGQEDHQKFRDWYRKRTEKEPPVNDDQNLLLVQLFFELKSGEPINKFAESFKQRIIDSEKASEYFNDMTQDNSHQRLYDLFSEILALNRLYTTYPSRAVEERLSNSGMKVFNQLIDENHINLFQRKSQDEKDGEKVIGYMLSHPHLANAIYECWHHTTSSKNRNKHLQSAIRSSFKYGTNDHEKIAPLWALSNALKPESPNFKRLLYEPFDTSKKISYGLKRMHIHSLLESVYDYDSIKDDKGKIFLSYLLVWIQIELRCKKLELDVKKITENPPVNIAIETIKEVVSISSKEVDLTPMCYKLLQFFNEFNEEQQIKTSNAIIDLLSKYHAWKDWPFIFQKLRNITSENEIKEKFKITNPKLVKLGRNWLVNSDHWNLQLVWSGLPKRNDQKTFNTAISWLRNFSTHHSWFFIWEDILDKSTKAKENSRIKTLTKIGEFWLEKTLNEFPEHHSWRYVWGKIMEKFKGDKEKSLELIEISKKWLNKVPNHSSWTHVWWELINIDYVNNEELLHIANNWRRKNNNDDYSYGLICGAEIIPKNREWLDTVIRLLNKIPSHRSWPFIWEKLIGVLKDFSCDPSEYEEIVCIGQQWLKVNPDHQLWPFIWEKLTGVLKDFPCDPSEYKGIVCIGQQWLEVNQKHSSWDMVWGFFFDDYTKDNDFCHLEKDYADLGRKYLKESPNHVFGWSKTWSKLWDIFTDDPELIEWGKEWLLQIKNNNYYRSPLLVWKPLREADIDNLSGIGLTFLRQASKFREEKPSTSWLHIWKELWNDEYEIDELKGLGSRWLKESISAAPNNSEWGAIWIMLWSNCSDKAELRALANNCLNKSPNPPEVSEIRKLIGLDQTVE